MAANCTLPYLASEFEMGKVQKVMDMRKGRRRGNGKEGRGVEEEMEQEKETSTKDGESMH